MPRRVKGDRTWKNRPAGAAELSKEVRTRVPLPANEQQRVEEFFETLHALVYYRLGLRELVKGRDMTSGKTVPTAAAEDAGRQLARFDAELMVCIEKLEGASFLRAQAHSIRQFRIAHEVRLLEAVLARRLADPADFERNFNTMFPTTTYHLSPDLENLRAAIDAPDVRQKLSGRRPAIREAAALAVSHLRGHTVRVRTIKEAQSVMSRVEAAAGIETPPLDTSAELEGHHRRRGGEAGRMGRLDFISDQQGSVVPCPRGLWAKCNDSWRACTPTTEAVGYHGGMQTKTVITRYLLLSEAAEIARTSVSTVRHWIATGKLRKHRPGRRVLIALEDLEAFLRGQ